MFIIRETFTAKPGEAGKLAQRFKALMAGFPLRTRVMTDYIGGFNTVVMDTEVENLADFEKTFAEYATRADIREQMKGYTDQYLTGKREVFRVV